MKYLPKLSPSSHALRLVFASGSLCLGLLASCDRPPVQRNCEPNREVACPNLNDPAGRIVGTILYRGPTPLESASRPGVASGRIVLLLFDFNNPPPPQGSASSAVSFQTVSAAQVFANAVRNADGTVTATVPFQFPGISRAGVYQLRAFYSRNEELSVEHAGQNLRIPSGFHPLFSVRNLPVQGDVIGGAIEDPSAPVAKFVAITVGDRVESNGRVSYVMPEVGSVTDHITVYLARSLPLERPIFRLATEERTVTRAGAPVTLAAPARLTRQEVPPPPATSVQGSSLLSGPALLQYARDWGLQAPGTIALDMPRNPVIVESPAGANLPSFAVIHSLGAEECVVASLAGVSVRRRCQDDPLADAAGGFIELAADVNDNGLIDLSATSTPPYADAHPSLISGSPFFAGSMGRLPWIYPLVVIAKMHEPNAAERRLLLEGQEGRLSAEQLARLRTALNRSETLDESDPNDKRYPVVMFGSVVPSGSSAGFLLPWTSGHRQFESTPRVVIVPFGAEIRGPSRERDWHVIIPPQLPETADRLGRALANFQNIRCEPFDPRYDDASQITGLPEGRYGITLVGPAGQSWTVPNELSGFTTTEQSARDLCPNGVCSAPSQAFFFRVKGVELPFAEARCPSVR
ncbi:MAG: hypothetical protein Q8Q09_05905 [Deltaproteobacteria bacterium]|nr:hypothetical protein [Deltaproteobacteria bacterium]